MKTSLKLSKLLKENGFIALNVKKPHWWVEYIYCGKGKRRKWGLSDYIPSPQYIGHEFFPAYDILNDLCVKYAKEMFGKPDIAGAEELEQSIKMEEMQYNICCEHPTDNEQFRNGQERHRLKIRDMYFELNSMRDDCIGKHTGRILNLIQQNKQQEAEDYLWENCLFNSNNKK